MTYSEAFQMMKKGSKVRRPGWHPQEYWAFPSDECLKQNGITRDDIKEDVHSSLERHTQATDWVVVQEQ